jgi:hypothetical protein
LRGKRRADKWSADPRPEFDGYGLNLRSLSRRSAGQRIVHLWLALINEVSDEKRKAAFYSRKKSFKLGEAYHEYQRPSNENPLESPTSSLHPNLWTPWSAYAPRPAAQRRRSLFVSKMRARSLGRRGAGRSGCQSARPARLIICWLLPPDRLRVRRRCRPSRRDAGNDRLA